MPDKGEYYFLQKNVFSLPLFGQMCSNVREAFFGALRLRSAFFIFREIYTSYYKKLKGGVYIYGYIQKTNQIHFRYLPRV